MDNGYKTYSKTRFKEEKHPRSGGGTFKKSPKTEEDDVDYHYTFDKSKHARGKDGSFIPKNASDACIMGINRYGSGSGYGG